jgi:hypothetical protein
MLGEKSTLIESDWQMSFYRNIIRKIADCLILKLRGNS